MVDTSKTNTRLPRTTNPGRLAQGRTGTRAPAADFLVVAVGASAGGLEACTKLIAAAPSGMGMVFILIQHLDPSHESMMVELLASRTSMAVRQATDGMLLERDHLYVIPPDAYLSVDGGALRVSKPPVRHGARLPFDFLLKSLADQYGARAVCIVLSGTGADGTLGLRAVKANQGLVIAQEPNEAGQDGMPRSAIQTGAVDLVLSAADIPSALLAYNGTTRIAPDPADLQNEIGLPETLTSIIDLLKSKTDHDFTLYKRGTLGRRIERRMAMASLGPASMEDYLEILLREPAELEALAKDLLINVTRFFRDPAVFSLLAKKVIPDLLKGQQPGRSLRVWVAGCSSGEETYSLAMLFQEGITAAKADVKLQMFASDIDADAVATARLGVYPQTIETDVSAARLARFFSHADRTYRISPELRSMVVFAVQNILDDPPFSRLDMVSCRNLLIYLGPEAQAKVMSMLHFALREGGILLLGGSETVGALESRFETISKTDRLYRHLSRNPLGETGHALSLVERGRPAARPVQEDSPARRPALADLCRARLLETFAPAAVVINRKNECLYSLGPIDRYLRVAPGHATHDLLEMAPQGLRARLRSAIQKVRQHNGRVTIPAGQRRHRDASGRSGLFNLDIQPISRSDQELILACFVDQPVQAHDTEKPIGSSDSPRIAELEQELETTRSDLQGAIRDLEISAEEQKTINEEALSVNEEHQSTNEELLTSKEEMQSLNEEPTALNSQLQETLERQRTTSNDLQNILFSTDVATLFLDRDLNIRFFTPATKSLFRVIPGDVGRPLEDLNSLSTDGALTDDARAVLVSLEPIDREIETRSGTWFTRKILPYRTHGNGVDGVVITFTDITERKRAARALEAARQQAESASVAKSRFLAAASHDLRQPLQTLTLLQGLMAKTAQDDASRNLVGRFDQALSAMSGMLNVLLDINQIEAGIVRPEMEDFQLVDLLDRLRDEFTYHANASGLTLKVVSSALSIHSDPRLLEQMLRNLLSNALKYTRHGGVLMGCRRHGGSISIEVWDTGIGIPDSELNTIFDEYHQLDNAARDSTKGLGLGLSIVHRLGILLCHRAHVRSRQGKGSVFAIDVSRAPDKAMPRPDDDRARLVDANDQDAPRMATLLLIEDDPAVRELLALSLRYDGYFVTAAHDGVEALALLESRTIDPDLILTDFNLPNGLNGLQLVRTIRASRHPAIPAIILTGDISTETLDEIASQSCRQLAKPIKMQELAEHIHELLATADMVAGSPPARAVSNSGHLGASTVFVVDDDDQLREALSILIDDSGQTVECYSSSEAFRAAYHPGQGMCLLIDAYLPGMSGLDLLRWLRRSGDLLPTIVITGNGDVHMAVEAMKAGAFDFIEKPVASTELLASIERALSQASDSGEQAAWQECAASQVAGLTPRQREIMECVLAGQPSKNIAADLGISQRTVENHRASIMRKTGTKSLPALARLALAAAAGG